MTQTQSVKSEETFISSAQPLEAAVQKGVFAEKRACMFEWRRKPTRVQARRKNGFLNGKFGAAKPAPRGRLSLPTFFGEAKKVGRRAAIEREVISFCKVIQAA
ncbi:MAG: hypothetical protein Q4G42_07285 [Neisseria sp.]|nr:hypothetical protein [Neisseria sp.]